MSGLTLEREQAADDLVAELTAVALRVARRHGVQGSSVDTELGVWHDLDTTLHGKATQDCTAELTESAFHSLLAHGVRGSSIGLHLDLWAAFRRTLAGHRAPCAV
jgi:hypothetical protein